MAARTLALAFCALSFLQTSFAGYERFWIFSKNADSHASESWDSLSEEEQRALIKRYQNLKEIPEDQRVALQQRMDWFTQLPDEEKAQMREAWQQMSTSERNELRKKMLATSDNEKRKEIRESYFKKYNQMNTVSH